MTILVAAVQVIGGITAAGFVLLFASWLIRCFKHDPRMGLTYVEPRPPENVRLVTTAGDEIPVDLLYVGRDPETGFGVWAMPEPCRRTDIERVRVSVLPARTRIAIHWVGPR